MSIVEHIPAIIRVILVFILVLICIRKNLSLGNAFILRAIFLSALFGLRPAALPGFCFHRCICVSSFPTNISTYPWGLSIHIYGGPVLSKSPQALFISASFTGCARGPENINYLNYHRHISPILERLHSDYHKYRTI